MRFWKALHYMDISCRYSCFLTCVLEQEEKLRALSQRDDFARQLGKDPTKLFPPGGNTLLPGEQALKYAEVLERRMKARPPRPVAHMNLASIFTNLRRQHRFA
eukprot:scaffold58146_cov32-Prasinocladus_malaysianus.AAC.1